MITFIVPWITFCYEVIPVKVCNAPTTFQRLMKKVMEPYLKHVIRLFMDDIGIYEDRASHFKKIGENC